MTNPLLIGLGLGVAAIAFGLFYLVQALTAPNRRDDRAGLGGEDEDDPLVVRSPDDPPPGWDDRLDSGFESLVEGARVGMPPDKVLALVCLVAVFIGGTLFLWRDQFWLGVGGGVAALVIPFIVLWFFRNRNRAAIQKQLPDFLFLLARSLRAGMNLEQALQLAIDQDVEPISDAVRPIRGHLRLGMPLPRALERVAHTLRLLDFDTFVSVVSFHRANGGNLALLLDRLGQSVRDRNLFQGHLSATTAQARFTALLVGLAGPLLLVGYAVFQPEHVVAFFQSTWGWVVLGGALAVELVAATVMYQILRIDY